MSIARARAHLDRWGLATRIIETQASSATVAQAAAALGTDPAHIAKTLSFLVDGEPLLVVAAGDARAEHALFVNGDAESLPLATDSVDVLLSLETSCTYPDLERFYREVARVLRPGGTFLYADLMPTAIVDSIEVVLGRLGLDRGYHRDISANVVASRQARAGRQARRLGW